MESVAMGDGANGSRGVRCDQLLVGKTIPWPEETGPVKNAIPHRRLGMWTETPHDKDHDDPGYDWTHHLGIWIR